MKIIEITFRCIDDKGREKELRRTVRMHVFEIASSRVPLSQRAAYHAEHFWESIVLMGVLDEQVTKK